MTVQLDNAPLPQTTRRPKASPSYVSEADCKSYAKPALEWPHGGLDGDWSISESLARTLLVGGPMNGQRLDLTYLGDARIVRVPFKADPNQWEVDSYEWYERGEQPNNDARYHCGSDSSKGFEVHERIIR